jgi:hypothetical protein
MGGGRGGGKGVEPLRLGLFTSHCRLRLLRRRANPSGRRVNRACTGFARCPSLRIRQAPIRGEVRQALYASSSSPQCSLAFDGACSSAIARLILFHTSCPPEPVEGAIAPIKHRISPLGCDKQCRYRDDARDLLSGLARAAPSRAHVSVMGISGWASVRLFRAGLRPCLKARSPPSARSPATRAVSTSDASRRCCAPRSPPPCGCPPAPPAACPG